MMKSMFASATAFLLATPIASAQTEAPAPTPPSAAPTTRIEPAPDGPTGEPSASPLDVPDANIEVSLGRREVKQEVAQLMGVTPVDVPLTVRVTLDVAQEVCGQTVFGSATDADQSCTATEFAPALVDAARETMRSEADVLPSQEASDP